MTLILQTPISTSRRYAKKSLINKDSVKNKLVLEVPVNEAFAFEISEDTQLTAVANFFISTKDQQLLRLSQRIRKT